VQAPVVPSVLAIDRVEPGDLLSRHAPVYVLFPPGKPGDPWPSKGRRNDYQPVPVGLHLDEAIARMRWPLRRLRRMSPRAAWLRYGIEEGAETRQRAIYGRELRSEGETILQYFAFYAYDDASNRHESDWEVVTLFLPGGDAVYSVHEGALRRPWRRVIRLDDRGRIDAEAGTHPLVYVALGSHAQFFSPHGAEPVVPIEPEALPPINRRYRLVRLPDGVTQPTAHVEGLDPAFAWLGYPARWGRGAAPFGPMFGDAWDPRAWVEGRAVDDDGTTSG
jgi:hypothetical protein